MAQQDDPYGLMAAMTPQAAPTAYTTPYIPPAAAGLGAGLSALGAQQMALQKQIAQEEEQRIKERESRLQKQGEQLYEIGQASFQPELMARGAALRAGGLLPVASEQFLPAARLSAVEKGAKVIGEAAGVAKYMTPESAKAFTEQVAKSAPGLAGLEFDFLSGGGKDSTYSVGLLNLAQRQREYMDKNLADEEAALNTRLQTPGVLTDPNERRAASERLRVLAGARQVILTMPDEQVNALYEETAGAKPVLKTGVRTTAQRPPGEYTDIKGDRLVTVRVLPGGGQEIIGTKNADPTTVQTFRMGLAREAADRANRNLDSLLKSRDFTQDNALVERARKDRTEGRLTANQARRLEIAEALLDLRERGADQASTELSLKIAQYFNPSFDPGKLTADSYDRARGILASRLRDDKGRPVSELLKSRSDADRRLAEELIANNIDETASELMRTTLDAQTNFWRSNPILLNNLYRNLGRPTGSELPERPGTPSPAGGTGAVPLPPALPPGVRPPGLPPAGAATGVRLPALPGGGSPVPPPPPLLGAPKPGAGSSRVSPPTTAPGGLRDAVGTPAGGRPRIRRPGS